MNLSSYLQMPPAPLTSNNTNTAVPQGPRTGAGASAGGNLGFDFAQVMAQQIERLAPQERQTFAADAPQPTSQESHSSEPRAHSERAHRNASASTDEQDASDSDETNNASRTATPRTRHKGAGHKSERPDVDELLAGLMQGTPIETKAPAAMANTIAPAQTPDIADASAMVNELAVPTASSNTPAVLQSTQLSQHLRILTAPQAAPSPESLVAFAKAMGLDDATVQNLMAQTPLAAQAQTSEGRLTAGVSSLLMTQPHDLSHAAPTGDDMVTLQLAAMNATTQAPPALASGAGLAAPATTLTASAMGMTAADMAAIQQVQITVLPTAVLPANTTGNIAPPSTIDMLSLMGAGIDEHDVNELLTQFSENTNQESHQEQPSSSEEEHHFTGFAQTLTRQVASASGTSVSTAAQSTSNMSEVYDQLSDKMATEMAARMHKQLSDGQWKMKFALRPSNLGGVEIQLEMKDGQLNAAFQADNPLTRDLLQNSSQRLKEALGNFGINAGQVNVGQGGGNASQNSSGNAGKQPQVRDNSSTQVNGTGSASSTPIHRNKANASLLDLYA